MKYMIKPTATLFLVAFFASAALAYTFSVTNPKIQKLKKEKEAASMRLIFKDARRFETKKSKGLEYKIAFDGSDKSIGAIFTVLAKGYSTDPIGLLVGVSDGKVVGIDIVEQKETPGLGSLITENWFKNQFKNKTLKDKIEPKKDIDAITGATISSRAVANGVREALEIAKKEGI